MTEEEFKKDFSKRALCLDDYNKKKMDQILIAFDVDGVLIDEHDNPHKEVVAMANFLAKKMKNITVMVWSGGGQDYARTIGERLGLKNVVYGDKLNSKLPRPHIAFDDQQAFSLAEFNCIVRLK